jgi:hypothetical protein
MTTEAVCAAVLDWAKATTSIVTGYDHIPAESTGPLPDVIVDCASLSIVETSDLFPHANIQQAWVAVFVMDISVMVDNTAPETAAQALRTYADSLRASLLANGTLGGRVPMVSKRIEFDFTLPFVVRNDGVRGREMTMRMTVAELVEEEG